MTKEEFDEWFYYELEKSIKKDYEILLALAWTILYTSLKGFGLKADENSVENLESIIYFSWQ